MSSLTYGLVFVNRGKYKGRILYYDDEEGKTAICYVGHPIDFVECYGIPEKYLREPTIDDLMTRREAIWRTMTDHVLNNELEYMDADEIHSLWSERSMIETELHERRMFGKLDKIESKKSVFLCHCSADKGRVRMVNDDLKRVGVDTWLDENIIKVGDSIVGKITEGLGSSQIMAIFLSSKSIESVWAKREWQSFLSRQLSGDTISILPILLEKCKIPEILSDIRYADFSESYHDGFMQLYNALK